MAGDQDKDRRAFYYSVAEAISTNPGTDNIVFFLTNEMEPLNKMQMSNRLVKYGIGTGHVFEWDRSQCEEDNYRRLDQAHLKAYFSDDKMTFDLKKAKFDVGIGGLNFADSILFRNLEIPYIKISEEDVESYTMHGKLGMPVLTSMYPSSKIWSRFSYLNLPDFGSLDYRFPFFFLYQADKYHMWSHKSAMRGIVGEKKAYLIDDWDQDHAMIIGHGARAGVYQSIMMKPPNVRYVYPLAKARDEVEIPERLAGLDALIVFNAESDRRDDLMFDKE